MPVLFPVYFFACAVAQDYSVAFLIFLIIIVIGHEWSEPIVTPLTLRNAMKEGCKEAPDQDQTWSNRQEWVIWLLPYDQNWDPLQIFFKFLMDACTQARTHACTLLPHRFDPFGSCFYESPRKSPNWCIFRPEKARENISKARARYFKILKARARKSPKISGPNLL